MEVLERGKKNMHYRWTYTCPYCGSKLLFDDDDPDMKIDKYSMSGHIQYEMRGKCPICLNDFKAMAGVQYSHGLIEETVWK